MLIKVTQDNINWGYKANCQKCPVSLAINAAIPGANSFTDLEDALITYNGVRQLVKLPTIASQFIKSFDWDEQSPEPFEFELEVKEFINEN